MQHKKRGWIQGLIACFLSVILVAGLVLIPDKAAYATEGQEVQAQGSEVVPEDEQETVTSDDETINGDSVTGPEDETNLTDQDEVDAGSDQEVTDEYEINDSSDQDIADDYETDEDLSDGGRDQEIEESTDTYQDQAPDSNGNQDKTDRNLVKGKSLYDLPSDLLKTYSVQGTGTGFTIQAEINDKYKSSYSFLGLYIDDTSTSYYLLKNFSNQTKISKQTLSLTKFGLGFHTMILGVQKPGGTTGLVYQQYLACNNITAKPTYTGRLEVYAKSLDYYPYNMALANQEGKLYLEYSTNNWKTFKRSGYMKANVIKLYTQQGYNISGFKANTKYKLRIRYGEYVTYETDAIGDGKSHFFGGPVFNIGTIKTGKAAKVKIKSIKVKPVKIKYRKVKHYGAYTGVYLYTEKFYTCKFKVTVKLKKKPGTAGIVVNGRFLKGNKKKYTTTFTPYPNYFFKKPPKGLKKYSVTVRSYQSKSYGGYSPTKTKKVKVKK